MSALDKLKIKIFADGADKAGMVTLYRTSYVRGLTTNPTLMKKAGITDYEHFSKEVLQLVVDKPISLEVFTDDLSDMLRQARKIAAWGNNVYVKIPITNANGDSCIPIIKELSSEGLKLNVTALLTLRQVGDVSAALHNGVPSIVSVFAGRIADTGVDPVPVMQAAKSLLEGNVNAELLWASVREVFNIVQAERAGVDIVTVPHDILGKAEKMLGTNLTRVSLETVQMFSKDAITAGYRL